MKKRIEFIDSLKGLLIILVVWGHIIQYVTFKNSDFYHNKIWEIIYSFHMPLFFVISGFFFLPSMQLNFISFFKKKISQLLLPSFTWSLLFVLISLFNHSVNTFLDFKNGINDIINHLSWPFWFLKELFVSYSLTYLSFKIIRKDSIAFLLCLLIILFTSKFSNYQRSMFPFFMIGYYLKRYQDFILNEKHTKVSMLLLLSIYLICLIFWNGSYTMYVTEFISLYSINTKTFHFNNLDITLFRLFVGLVGSLFLFILFSYLYKNNKIFRELEKIGRYSLSIYIFQSLVIEFFLNNMICTSINRWVIQIIINPVYTFFVVYISIILTYLICKVNVLGVMLFGTTYKKNTI